MKIRTLIISILAVLVVSNASPAQVAEAPEQEPQEPALQESDSLPLPQTESSFVAQAATAPTPGIPRQRWPNATPAPTQPGVSTKTAPKSTAVLRIFELKYAEARELARLIGNIFRIQVDIDYRLNRIIVNATQEQMENIESLIEATDVEAPEESTPRDVRNLVYRIFMFEISSKDKDEDMKLFSMILQTPAKISSVEFLQAAEEGKIHISDFLISDEQENEQQVDILIRGKAPSTESLTQIVGLTESRIKELKWDDDETFTSGIKAAHYSQLPAQMQKYLQRFLGEDIVTVGYWFGSSSVPGDIEAPIGPWILNLRFDTESDRMLELDVEVEVPREMYHFERRLGHERSNEILSNTIRAKIGKPVIIGYNRESYGTRRMGAMVIIPEVDTIQLEAGEKSF
jgi:hypothetical protein